MSHDDGGAAIPVAAPKLSVGTVVGTVVGGAIGGPVGAFIGQGVENANSGGSSISDLTHGTHDANLVAYKNSIWNDDTLDEASKIRLQKILDTTGTKGFPEELALAKDGKGVYGVFKKNSELLNAMKDRPGRSQTILPQGASAMTGQQPTGLLTDLNKR